MVQIGVLVCWRHECSLEKQENNAIFVHTKVRSLLEHSCVILISFQIVVIFNTTSADIKTKSADVILKMTTILKEMRIAQLWSKSERTLVKYESKIILRIKVLHHHFYLPKVIIQVQTSLEYSAG